MIAQLSDTGYSITTLYSPAEVALMSDDYIEQMQTCTADSVSFSLTYSNPADGYVLNTYRHTRIDGRDEYERLPGCGTRFDSDVAARRYGLACGYLLQWRRIVD